MTTLKVKLTTFEKLNSKYSILATSDPRKMILLSLESSHWEKLNEGQIMFLRLINAELFINN